MDGKLLCWLCTLSYKRALAKARQVETDRRAGRKRTHSNDKPQQVKENSSNGSGLKPISSSRGNGASGNDLLGKLHPLPELPPEKVGRMGNSGGIMDPNSSDHVIAMTQLKETIASLQRKLTMKDKELLEKDKMVRGFGFSCSSGANNRALFPDYRIEGEEFRRGERDAE